jgi:polysaccharide export outer membrane protein
LKPVFLVFAAFALLTGCVHTDPVGRVPGVVQLATDQLPAPTSADLIAANRPYLIGPLDKLRVEVFNVPEMQTEVQADANGRFSFPLIGVIDASGLTTAQLADELTTRLRTFVKNPQVTVNLVSTTSQVVTVEGQVARPGMYPVLGRMTLVRAIAAAGGTAEMAKLDDVVVFRDVSGQRYAGIYNLAAIRRGNYADPEIYSNDVVIVGDSKQRRLMRDLIQLAPIISTPIIVLTQNL